MSKYKYYLLPLLFIIPISTNAAEVVLVNPETVSGQQNNYPSYSAEKRINDLFDFDSFGEYGEERSGMITGQLTSSLEYVDVGGNKSKSFYEDSVFNYQNDLSLQMYEKLWNNYRFEALADLRITSLERVEVQEDIRLKQLNLKLVNPENLFEFGNFYSEFSRFTMGSSLEGFNTEINPIDSRFNYKMVVARLNQAEIGVNQKNVYGAHVNIKPFELDENQSSDLSIGVQSVLTRDDDGSSIRGHIYAPAMYNWVASTDGKWKSFETGVSAKWELAYSEYNEDKNDVSQKIKTDRAFRISPSWRYKNKFDLSYLYYNAGPDYFTATGSAVRDKEQHQINSNYRFNSDYTLSLTQNWYWDKLSGSNKTKRTTNSETSMSLLARPLKSRESFSIRPYIKKFVRDSDDAANSSSADTDIYGFSVNDVVMKASVGGFAELRDYQDRSGNGNSEEYIRYGFNFSRDFIIYDNPLYISASYSGSIRNPASESDNEIQNGFTFNGRYNLDESDIFNFGYNFLNTDSAGNIDDYDTYTSFIEYSHQFKNKRKTEMVFRSEYNKYDYETDSEDYRENRYLVTLVTYF